MECINTISQVKTELHDTGNKMDIGISAKFCNMKNYKDFIPDKLDSFIWKINLKSERLGWFYPATTAGPALFDNVIYNDCDWCW